jgi:RimJ/RimL family protein N-acetyltransferase
MSTLKDKTFESKRLSYREISIDDTENIVRWRSLPEIYRCFKRPKPLSVQEHIDWYNQKYISDPTRVEYIILHKESSSPIGLVGVSNLTSESLEVGYLIGELSHQRRGYAVEAINAVVDKYSNTGVRYYFAEIRADNEASIKTVEKCGFKYDKELDSGFLLYKKVSI